MEKGLSGPFSFNDTNIAMKYLMTFESFVSKTKLDLLNEGRITLTPAEENELRKLVPIAIQGIKDRKIDTRLAGPIKYIMASGEEASFYFEIYYDDWGGSQASFFKEDPNDLHDNIIGINYYYFGPAFEGTLQKIWSKITKDSPNEALLTCLRHELIHAKDPVANHHKLKIPEDYYEIESAYYGSWHEFPTMTGEFFEILKNRTDDSIRSSRDMSKTATELQFYFKDILNFYSKADQSFDPKTWKWIASENRNAVQKFVKDIVSFGGNFLTPAWSQGNLLGKFSEKIKKIKYYNRDGYKKFQKELYKLIQELTDKVNDELAKAP
jgi:hypothetical protein